MGLPDNSSVWLATHMALLDAVPARCAVVDQRGIVLAVNGPWRRSAADTVPTGLPTDIVGQNYLELCHSARDSPDATRIAAAMRSVLDGHVGVASLDCGRDDAGGRRWYRVTLSPAVVNDTTLALVTQTDITELMQQQEALRASEARLRSIVEYEPECVKVVSPGGRLLEMNAAGLRMIEAESLDEVRGERLVGLIAPGHRAAFSALHARVMAGDSGTLVFECIGRRGGRRWLETHAAPLLENGRVTALLGITRDITERKRTEEAIRLSESRYRRLVESNVIGVVIAGTDGRIAEANDCFLTMVGFSRDELAAGQLRWDTITPPEWHDVDRKAVLELTSHGITKPFEKEYLHRDGHRVPIVATVALLDGTSGDAICLIEDITDRKQAERALQESQERFETIFKAAPGSMALFSLPDGKAVEINDQFTAITGYTRNEIIGKTTGELRMWADPGAREEFLAELGKAGMVRDFEADLRHRSGTIRNGLVSGNIVTASGQQYLLGVFADITARKLTETALALSEANLAAAQARAHLGSWEIDLDSGSRAWSAEHSRLHGRDPSLDAPTLEGFLELVHPEDRAAIAKLWAGVEQVTSPVSYEYRTNPADGPIRHLATTLQVVRARSGRVARVEGTALDITDRRLAEDMIRRSERRLRDLIDGLGPHMFVGLMTLDGTLIEANRAALEAAGLTLDDVAGRPVDETYWWSYSEAVQLQLTEAIARAARGEPVRYDVQLRVADKQFIIVDFSLQPLRDDAGQVVLLVPSAIVITERKQAEQATREAHARLQLLSRRLLDIQESERRYMARELHDEIGQALTAAKINLQSLRHYPDTVTSRLDDSIGLVSGALEQVRSLSLELRPPMLDDLGLVATLRWLVDQHLRRTGLRMVFSTDLPDARVSRPIDIACFRIAQEGLTNIARHSGATQVTVDLHEGAGILHLHLRDDGMGFDVRAARQRALQGGSLGLLGMEERAALAGGGVEWRSASGQGTEVHAWFALPVAEVGEEPVAPE